ncbi:hypothetical protein [Imperialibacter sp.]|uniref:hypothetical protein n=2 Tax=Imperialibacter sp. TaxID=2038411 RepID=UPI0032EEA871
MMLQSRRFLLFSGMLRNYTLLFCFQLAMSYAAAQSINYPVEMPGMERLIVKTKEVLAANGITDYDIAIKIGAYPTLKMEGYRIDWNGNQTVISANDFSGARYGLLAFTEEIANGRKPDQIDGRQVNPSMEVRAIKFNLPWDAYRESLSMDYHLSTCRDLKFWEAFLDMMMANRFNQLALYNMHPFQYMVKLPNYPEASPFTDQEMADWQVFWKGLFRMAKERGVEVFIVNWNIVVPESFAKHHGIKALNDTSQVVLDYTKEAVTTVINTYEDLGGLGVTLADWMTKMTAAEREDWIAETFVAGMKAADRPVKFLHRAVLSGSSNEMRRILDAADFQDPVQVEVKFNWSHGHSTPKLLITHASESGAVNTGYWNPAPENYKIEWMVRNEDFFILRWGEPDFIRSHIKTNTADFMNGYYIGSEGYIPAFEYFTKPEIGRTWNYAFERQWLFYSLWGRLLYDINTPDTVFEEQFNRKYHMDQGRQMLHAYKLVSKMPLRLASFFGSTWDYTLYAEGFMSPVTPPGYGFDDKISFFISLEELMDHKVLDPSYLSIKDYVAIQAEKEKVAENKKTPLDLANELTANATEADMLIETLAAKGSIYTSEYNQEIDDLRAWSLLSRYFARKLKAGVYLELFRKTGEAIQKRDAIKALEEALVTWKELSEVTSKNYLEVPYIVGGVFGFQDERKDYFSWKSLIPEVERDIEVAKSASFQK